MGCGCIEASAKTALDLMAQVEQLKAEIAKLQEVLKQAKACIQLGVKIFEGNSPDWTCDLMHWAYNDGMAAIDLIDKIGGGKDE